jgi:HTH-type transcriptional regulator / antitoxin HigA
MKRTGIADDYLELVRKFQLRPIRTDAENAQALKIVEAMIVRELTSGEADYVEALGQLVQAYETKRYPFEKASPLDVLKFLMDQHGMNTTALGKLVGGPGHASLILNGKRELNKANIRALAEYFKVNPGLFI